MEHKAPQKLLITGVADKRVFKLIGREFELAENQKWLFVDYAADNFSLNTQLTVLLTDEAGTLSNESFNITILECTNQFGHHLPEIPRGWKTICKISFTPAIPQKIDHLDITEGWIYNPDRVTLSILK